MSDAPTTNEEYTEQQEEVRQDLIEQDIEMHEETGDEPPFPGDAADVDAETEKAKKPKKVKKTKK